MISVFYNLWFVMYMDLFIVCLDWLLITYNFLCYIVRFDFAGATIQVWGDEHALQRSRFLVAAIQGWGDARVGCE